MAAFDFVEGPINALSGVFSGAVSRLLVSLVIFFVGFIIGKLLGKLTAKILHELNVDYLSRKAFGVKFSFEDAISAFVTYFIYFISLIMALNEIGLTTTMFTIIFAAIIVLIVISILLGIWNFIPNFMSGLVIKQKNFLREGDVIKIKDIEGKIIAIDVLETRIKNKHGDIIFVPNLILTKHEIINYKIKPKKEKLTK